MAFYRKTSVKSLDRSWKWRHLDKGSEDNGYSGRYQKWADWQNTCDQGQGFPRVIEQANHLQCPFNRKDQIDIGSKSNVGDERGRYQKWKPHFPKSHGQTEPWMAQREVVWTRTADLQFASILEYWANRNKSSIYSKKLIGLVSRRTKQISLEPFSYQLTDFTGSF